MDKAAQRQRRGGGGPPSQRPAFACECGCIHKLTPLLLLAPPLHRWPPQPCPAPCIGGPTNDTLWLSYISPVATPLYYDGLPPSFYNKVRKGQ